MRDSVKVVCKICNFETNTHGMATHLRDRHSISVSDYVSIHEEYRPKYIDYNDRSKDSGVVCVVCGSQFASERHLTFHIKKAHDKSKYDYIVNDVLLGIIPLCKCGCGNQVKIKDRGSQPYWSDYLLGHNTQQTHIGSVRSYESRMRMRDSAIKRLQNGDSVFYRGRSNDEIEFGEFVSSLTEFDVVFNDTSVLSGRELDVYIPSLNLAFELNGERFHSDLFKSKLYHLDKTLECANSGIRLIHVWLSDWLKKRDIVKSQISYLFGKVNNKIYARKCTIGEVSYKECELFLNTNHLQGNSISKIRYGLYFEGELVQVITFGNLRKATGRNKSDGVYELIRLASKIDISVVGGASKLFNHFVKTHSPSGIVSFANRDWSVGGVYGILGMSLVGYTDVGYFYSNGNRKEHRYNFQKHKLVEMGFDASKTEYEIMSERGYYRIWNTGNIVYKWNS